jgi:hypothetical protein
MCEYMLFVDKVRLGCLCHPYSYPCNTAATWQLKTFYAKLCYATDAMPTCIYIVLTAFGHHTTCRPSPLVAGVG